MARGLLAEGRAADVARMLEPLLNGISGGVPASPEEAGQIVLRCLVARVHLLRSGDAQRVLEALRPFEPSAVRAGLPASVRAETALWLGWAYAWQDSASFDAARALHLFDEAERLFRDELNATGRCWTLIGQALAYQTLDEFGLMLQALDEAAALQEKLQDVQAALWIQDLRIAGLRFQGRYAQALACTDTLFTLAHQHQDAMARGRAHAHRAVLLEDLGRAPAAVIEDALQAESLLAGATPGGTPLLTAYCAHIHALVRSGAWNEARGLAERGLAAFGASPTASARLLLQKARLALLRGRLDEAERVLEDVLRLLPHQRHRLLAARVALVQGEFLARRGERQRAREWMERAYRTARQAGYVRHQLRALLALAEAAAGLQDLPGARSALHEAEKFGDYFSLLPFAALRFRTLGRLARAEENVEEARSYLAQALSAYSLIGDVFATAQVQLELAQLGRSAAPVQARPLLEAALVTFEALQAPAELREARALLAAWPPENAAPPEPAEGLIGASLARASLSVDLVAETWLQVLERLLPGRWTGVYRCLEDGPWHPVREHGRAPADLTFADPGNPRTFANGVLWLRLRGHPGPAFFVGIALDAPDEPAWSAAYERLKPWFPVAALALEHALLRAQRLDTSYRLSAAEEADVQVPLPHFVYASPAMRELVRQIQRIRASHSAVLITGESGTGKELIAQAVHATSERKDAPFIAFNCSNVPHELFDSHLFGHEKGSFTGAVRAHPGVIRAADGGTLFLDEIGDLPLDVQPKLLRFLQEGEVFPLGARRPVQVNVRIIAATNQDLEGRIREGRFREDLYYRLNVIPLRVPPLRQRREEIPLLVRHFLATLRQPGMPVPSITNRAMEALLRYGWPGNVRQLRNEIERALVFVSSEPAPTVDLADLSPVVLEAAGASPSGLSDPGPHPAHDLESILAETERAVIERVLAEQDGQVTATAGLLGLTRQGLYKKMKRLGIDASQFQTRADKDRTEAQPEYR